MGAYILQPKNYMNQHYFAPHAFLNRFVLSVHDAIHSHISKRIEFLIELENCAVMFYIPVYFKKMEYAALNARSPPLGKYQEVAYGIH